MSIEALNGVLKRDGWTTPQFAVLFLLANHADAAGECFPSYPYLMRKTGLSERGLRKVMAELEVLEVLRRVHPKSATGKSLPLRFFLPFADPEEGGTTCRPMGAPRAGLAEGEGGTTCRPMGAPRAAPTKEEPSIEEPTSEPKARAGEAEFADLSAAWAGVSPGRVSPVKAWAAFAAAAGRCAPERILAAGRRYLAEDADVKRLKTAISLHSWLAEDRWAPWLAASARPGAASPGWAGPAEIRAWVVERRGEAFAAGYLDRSAWDGERGAILTATRIASERLAEAINVVERAQLGVAIIEKGRSS